MTKPWEEEWEYDQNWPEYVAHSGVNIAKFREGAWDPEPHDEARARLASKAPKMANLLARILDEHAAYLPYTAGDIEAVLREAGVLE